jgi:signal peptide peptidase SppA
MRAGGVAVLAINGPLAPKANLFTQISGGASAQQLVQQIEAMADSAAVRSAVLVWDSPGGSVQGIPTLARAVRALADAKPTVSVADGVMASAAYWAASGANAIYASGQTDMIGSIGVVATHTYDPRSSTRQVTEIVAGRYKRIASGERPLTPEGEAYIQAQVDEIYRVFVETVADARGVPVEDVLAYMADGRVFVGRQAQAVGLVDGFAAAEEVAGWLAEDPARFAGRKRASIAALSAPPTPAAASGATPAAPPRGRPVSPAAAAATTGVNSMPTDKPVALNADEIAAQHPEGATALRAQGAQAERERIAAVREQLMPGHEALIERLAADGVTTGPQAAMQVLQAERAARGAQAAARAADAPRPLALDPAPAAEDVPKPAAPRNLGAQGRLGADVDSAALDREARSYMAAHPGTTYVAAIKAVQQLHQGA